MTPQTRHAEYKIPEGKLVVVDLIIDNGVLSYVQLSGDFFMEPIDTLEVINTALTGLQCTASRAQIQQCIESAIAPDVMLYGINIAGITTVIERALEQ